MATIINENIDAWVLAGEIPTKDLKLTISNYLIENNVPKNFWPSSEKQNESIKNYCEKNKIFVKINHVISVLGVSTKVCLFNKIQW